MPKTPSSIDPQYLLNRELSWLEFNQRVLEEALDPSTPLLERVKFFCLFNDNLDEFFETRVAALKQQIESVAVERSPDGLTATETYQAVNRKVRLLVARQYACWREELLPPWRKTGFVFRASRNFPSPIRPGWTIFTARKRARCSRRWVWIPRIRFPSC